MKQVTITAPEIGEKVWIILIGFGTFSTPIAKGTVVNVKRELTPEGSVWTRLKIELDGGVLIKIPEDNWDTSVFPSEAEAKSFYEQNR